MRAMLPNPPEFVAELIHAPTRSWNRELVQQNLLPMDAQAVFSIPLSMHATADYWAWHYERT